MTIDAFHIPGRFTYPDDWTWKRKLPDNWGSIAYVKIFFIAFVQTWVPKNEVRSDCLYVDSTASLCKININGPINFYTDNTLSILRNSVYRIEQQFFLMALLTSSQKSVNILCSVNIDNNGVTFYQQCIIY